MGCGRIRCQTQREAWRAFCCACILCCLSAQARASGPYIVDDAAISDPGHCHVESWVSAAGNGDLIAVVQPACVARLGIPVEFRTTLEPVRFDGVWTTFGGLQIKFIVLPYGTGIVAVAMATGTFIDVDSGESLTYVNIPITLKAGNNVRFNLNTGWMIDSLDAASSATWGASVEWDVIKSWRLTTEVFSQMGGSSDPGFQSGLRYSPTQSLDIDLIYGRNLAGEHASWITAGLTVRF